MLTHTNNKFTATQIIAQISAHTWSVFVLNMKAKKASYLNCIAHSSYFFVI